MSTREQIDDFFGHPGFDQTPTPRPLTDLDQCGRCRHPRWMHSGYGGAHPVGRCHMRDWELKVSCRCVNFVERDSGPGADAK